jgi:hypothetical protein
MGASIFFTAAMIRVNYDEKPLTGKKIFLVIPSISTGFVNTCPTVFL